ncbi:metallophosphoesterase [Streptomyces sp. WAC06614]|uniref:metallophosphoesterase n=1 Tax=Streptomyces sp. WAC06614 TaxID=2487416 RepID=UPI000F79AEEE|nr:metallophosphoesterase [Streptomyces sp. WAC06614]RSS80296.1 phosphodiesterase [Streptomyces sp. WAC06614]
MIVIAHLSDVHVDTTRRPADRTRAVMAYLDDLPYDLDAVLVSGDIADRGLAEEYDEARALLSSRHPLVVCPGNHDERGAFREGLLGRRAEPGPVNQVLRGAGFVLAVCDSSVPGKDEGLLEEETLTWLEGVLRETPADTPVLVAFHHPPVELHIPYVDGIRQFGEERLAELVARHPHLTAFLCGHAHTAAATTFAGRPLLVAPGVVSTTLLPWERQNGPAHFVHLDEPPAVAFHVIGEDGRLTTHYRVVIDRGVQRPA